MSRIERLTPEQMSRFPEFVEKWTSIGLCTDPANRPNAEAAIREMYGCAGFPAPKKIVWCGSPLSQGLTRAIILDNKLASVGASVGDSVGDSVRDSVWDSVRASVGASVGASVWDSVRASVGDSVWASVGASVGASVWDSVRDSVYGAHDADWLGFYDYFRLVCGLESETQKLKGLWLLAQSAGWAIPYRNVCWVSERHDILLRDERGMLHNLIGPAVMYPDGWAIYAVHGVRVPSDIIEKPDMLTKERILGEENAEVRRVMIEKVGNDKFLEMIDAKPIHEDARGKLFRIELANDEPMVAVQVVNSTPEPGGHHKLYLLRVHPELRPMLPDGKMGKAQALTVANAIASTFGLTGNDYEPAIET